MLREGTNVQTPATSAHPQRPLWIQAHVKPGPVHQLTRGHMDFNCGFWQMFAQPTIYLTRWGFGVTVWRFGKFLSDFDHQSSSGGLLFSQR